MEYIVPSLEVHLSSFQKQRGVKKEEFINNCVATVVNTGCAENIFFVHLVYNSVFQAYYDMFCNCIALLSVLYCCVY